MPASLRISSLSLISLSLWLSCGLAQAQNQPSYTGGQGQTNGMAPAGAGYPQQFAPQYSQQYAPPAGGQMSPQMQPRGMQPVMPQGAGYPGSPGPMPTMQATGYPGQAGLMPSNQLRSPSGMPEASGNVSVGQWFSEYDQVRHRAQMSPAERQKADTLMSKGLSLLVPGQEKIATKVLLNSLVMRYQRACQELRSLPQIGQTSNLHQSYFQYFSNAGQLFGDYARVQDNVFATDQAGQPIAASLMQRKQMLEGLEHQCKMLDAQTRQQFSVPPYQW